MEGLPYEIICLIVERLDRKSAGRFALTCECHYSIISEDFLRVCANFSRVIGEINKFEYYTTFPCNIEDCWGYHSIMFMGNKWRAYFIDVICSVLYVDTQYARHFIRRYFPYEYCALYKRANIPTIVDIWVGIDKDSIQNKVNSYYGASWKNKDGQVRSMVAYKNMHEMLMALRKLHIY